MSAGAAAAKAPPLLVHYVAIGRLSGGADPNDNSIVASHCTSDTIADASAYAKWFRALMTDHHAELREHTDARFHKLMPNAEGDVTPGNALHMYFLSSPADSTGTDTSGHAIMVYFAVCAPLYPERTPLNGPAHLLWELRENAAKQFGGAGLAGASEGGDVSAKAGALLEALCFVHGLDKFQHLDDALTKVKEQMHANITHALDNTDALNAMEEKAAELEEFASGWLIGTQRVKEKMCWQKWKTQLILLAIVVVLLVVIITPIVAAAGGPSVSDDSNSANQHPGGDNGGNSVSPTPASAARS